MHITNSFSLSMLEGNSAIVVAQTLTTAEAIAILKKEGVQSAIGHADTARILSGILGMDIPMNRVSIAIPTAPYGGEGIIVAQYSGPRLPEGATTLPVGAGFVLYLVRMGQDMARIPDALGF